MSDTLISASTLAHLTTDAATAWQLADAIMAVNDAGETAVATVEGKNGLWIVEIYFERAPDQRAVGDLVAACAGEAARASLAFTTVAARDWVARSLEGLAPVAAGRFVVHGGHDRARVPANRIGIEIEAALAFGTGHHGTTRGCLLAFDRLLKSLRPRRILDVGTGTGVLAIAAARALRHPVLAVDIDSVSVRVARDNVRINRAGTLVAVVRANGVASRYVRLRAPFDLVFANILLGPLQRLAKPIRRLAAPGSRVVVSGLLSGQANAALAAYRTAGFVLDRRLPLEGWVTLVLARPSTPLARRREKLQAFPSP